MSNIIKGFTLTPSDIEEMAMDIKATILHAMVKENVIDENTKKNWNENFAIMVREPSFWERLWNKKHEEGNRCEYIMVKKITQE